MSLPFLLAPGRWLVGLIREDPLRAILIPIGIHLALWTFLPAFFWQSAPLDVVEGYFWGREWEWGYHKHPPLSAWMLEALLVLGDGIWTSYLLGQISVIVTLLAVWGLARPMVGGPAAALAVLALDLNFYFTFPTTEFNPNVLQMPLWALAILHFHHALTTARWRYYFLTALWMGLLIYTKYSAVILALAFILVVLATDRGRAALRSPKLYIAALAALALALPHFHWIVASDYLPFTYALSQKEAPDLATRLYFPSNFLAAQIACHAVLFAVALWLAIGARGPARDCPQIPVQAASPFDRTYVFIMALGPLGVSLVLCFALGIEFLTMWGMPMFALSGLALIVAANRSFRAWGAARLATLYLVFLISLPVAVTLGLVATPVLTGKPSRTMWPGEYHGWVVNDQWRRETGQPLRVVAGPAWEAGLVGLHGQDRPSVLMDGDFRGAPWIDRDRLAETGLAIVWRVRDPTGTPPAWVSETFPDRIDLGLYDLPAYSLPGLGRSPDPYAAIGIAIVPPQPRQSASGISLDGTASITAQ